MESFPLEILLPNFKYSIDVSGKLRKGNGLFYQRAHFRTLDIRVWLSLLLKFVGSIFPGFRDVFADFSFLPNLTEYSQLTTMSISYLCS